MEATADPEGPPRFTCPEDFSAVPFAPGPPFSPETLQDPTKQLVLIRAPANFSPESLNGQLVPLSGSAVLQLDETHNAYSLQATPGELVSCARLLVPSDHQDQLTCAPPFAVSLNVRERFGDPSAHQILFPVTKRTAPRIPDGLRQRFLPFGGQPKRPLPPSSGDAQVPPRKKKKKRQLHTVGCMGDPGVPSCLEGCEHKLPCGESATPSQEPREGGRSSQQTEGLGLLFGALEQQPEEDIEPSSPLGASSQEGRVSGEAEELSHRIKKKKKKKHKEDVMENRERMVDPGSVTQQSQDEPQPVENGDSEEKVPAQHKRKKKKRHQEEDAEALLGLASPKEERAQEPCEESGVGGSLDCTQEEGPGEERSTHKSRKEKRKKEKREEGKLLGQETDPVLLEHHSVKQELAWDELDAASGQSEGWAGAQGLGTEGSSQKHKKKKKKREAE